MPFERSFVPNYLTDCEHRETEPLALCKLVSERVGFAHGINSRVCALCRIDGVPNEEFLRHITFGAMASHLQFLYQGFHKNDVAVDLFERTCKHASKDTEWALVAEHLKQCVAKGRISYEDARALMARYPLIPDKGLVHAQTAYLERGNIVLPAPTTTPCSSCGDKKPEELSFMGKVVNAAQSVVNAVTAPLADKASEKTQNVRRATCSFCGARDSKGASLFRVIEGKPYCGEPFVENVMRSPTVDGCGCPLTTKIAIKDEECPLKKWLPEV